MLNDVISAHFYVINMGQKMISISGVKAYASFSILEADLYQMLSEHFKEMYSPDRGMTREEVGEMASTIIVRINVKQV